MNINEAIDKICNQELMNKKINGMPMCVIVGGLSGSGKTNLVNRIEAENKTRNFVVIDSDKYRKLHPDYDELIKTPEKASVETNEFADEIEAELLKTAIKKHNDIISVSTLRATELVENLVYNPAKEEGYETEVDVMSVPIKESGLSAQIRYEQQIASGDCPRFTPMDFIEGTFQNIQNSIKLFEEKGTHIKVYSRGKGVESYPELVYDSNGRDNKYKNAVEAFTNSKTTLNSREALKAINELYNAKKKRNANTIEYESLNRLEEMFEFNEKKEYAFL